MTVPGSDPKYPAYDRGTGASAMAIGEKAFEVAAVDPLTARTAPAFTRRLLRGEQHELGFAHSSWPATEVVPAAVVPSSIPITDD